MRTNVVIVAAILALPLWAQETQPATPPDTQPSILSDLTDGPKPAPATEPSADPAQWRATFAQLQLDLDHARSQLEEMRQFLATQNLIEQLQAWRTERLNLISERGRLEKERRALEAQRSALRQDAARQAADAKRKDRDQKTTQAPRWSAQYMLGLINRTDSRQVLYIDSGNAQPYPSTAYDVDRQNVLVRGTLLNQAIVPYRYTFELRLTSGPPNDLNSSVLGTWRYQTPLLGAGQLHSFEVRVPVTDALAVVNVRMVNVVADRPVDAPIPEPAAGLQPGRGLGGTATLAP